MGQVISTGESYPEPIQVVKPLELFSTGIEQPLTESPTKSGSENRSMSLLWSTQQVLLTW